MNSGPTIRNLPPHYSIYQQIASWHAQSHRFQRHETTIEPNHYNLTAKKASTALQASGPLERGTMYIIQANNICKNIRKVDVFLPQSFKFSYTEEMGKKINYGTKSNE